MGPTLQRNSCVHRARGTTGERERWGSSKTEVSVGGLTYTCRPSRSFFDSRPCFYSLIHFGLAQGSSLCSENATPSKSCAGLLHLKFDSLHHQKAEGLKVGWESFLPNLGEHWLSPGSGVLWSLLGRGRFAISTFHPWSRPSVMVYFLLQASWWILERDIGVSAALAVFWLRCWCHDVTWVKQESQGLVLAFMSRQLFF